MKLTLASCLTLVGMGVVSLAIASPASAQRRPALNAAGELLAQSDSDADSHSGSPEIYFPETTFDYGVAGQHEKLTHVFKVRNVGDAPLKIIDARGT